ncbi:MAG TPA: SgcJ/EcaC family oxidoreductase [Flavobacteriaceae bacterium]|nr:SgcJ/EcaC family oxidoreductase [Flavobacteriaceae bacterium]MCB9213129.1 SgcJ/EcaC family oxidoreductase [Alteromonas sp.]HPF11035.1 SgcJ/EcaC family oxidoreductase [Flavobacteriaceae bacterium]HQU21866.1 SgcJ/EcaC family oxidoreductase [Flavobacteriaceae bacterium]HQU64116.1 SgcJ/EcaC family oxidoreductase [Flavobacteriaceae bacterium]
MKKLAFIFIIAIISNSVSAQSSKDEQDIKNTVHLLQQGWNSGSGETFASAFAEPHDFIVWNGYYMKNLSVENNAKGHNQIFSTFYKGTQLFYTIDKIKFLSKDIALVHIFGAVVNQNEARPKDPEVVISMVLQKNQGVWKIVSFHNLDLEAFQNEEIKKNAPMPIEVMYASWYAEAK